MPRLRWTAALITAVALASCGGQATSASDQVAGALKTYLAALARGNGATACDRLTDAFVQRHIQGAGTTTCTQAIQVLAGQLGGDGKAALEHAKVVNIHVRGATATAVIRGGTQEATLNRTGGRWLIASEHAAPGNRSSTAPAPTASSSASSSTASTPKTGASSSAADEATSLKALLELHGYHVTSFQLDPGNSAGPSADFQAIMAGRPTVTVIVYNDTRAAHRDGLSLASAHATRRGAYMVVGSAVVLVRLGTARRRVALWTPLRTRFAMLPDKERWSSP